MPNEIDNIPPKKRTNFWEFWGKISAFIATIAAIIGVINTFPNSAISISVYADSTEYYLAPIIKAKIMATQEVEYKDILRKAISEQIKKYRVDEIEIDNMVYLIQGIVDSKFKFIDVNDRYGYEKIYTIDIFNNGNNSIEELKLKLNASGYYLIKTASEEYFSGEFKNTISIGKVNAKEQYKVFVWTSYMDEYDKQYYSHKQGAGEIKFPYKVYGIWAILFEYKIVVIIIIIVGVILVLAIRTGIKEEKNKKDKIS